MLSAKEKKYERSNQLGNMPTTAADWRNYIESQTMQPGCEWVIGSEGDYIPEILNDK